MPGTEGERRVHRKFEQHHGFFLGQDAYTDSGHCDGVRGRFVGGQTDSDCDVVAPRLDEDSEESEPLFRLLGESPALACLGGWGGESAVLTVAACPGWVTVLHGRNSRVQRKLTARLATFNEEAPEPTFDHFASTTTTSHCARVPRRASRVKFRIALRHTSAFLGARTVGVHCSSGKE